MVCKEYHLGLIGFPIDHSISPRLHCAALQASHLVGDYRLFPIPNLPAGEGPLKSIIERIRQGELDGVNITIPHKQNALSLVDELSSTVKAIGAMNTIYKKDGVLYAENTDVAGFINDLKRVGVEKKDTPGALVLGAGGAARAVSWGLLTEGWRVIILARHFEQAQQVVDRLSQIAHAVYLYEDSRISTQKLEIKAIQQLVIAETITLIVNTTPLGMTSHPQGVAWPVEIPFPQGTTIYDLVYTPPETELIRLAHKLGLPAYNGLGMLVEQAALAFEIWTGVQAPRQAMWHSVKHLQETK